MRSNRMITEAAAPMPIPTRAPMGNEESPVSLELALGLAMMVALLGADVIVVVVIVIDEGDIGDAILKGVACG
jgi:hypothetical protein